MSLWLRLKGRARRRGDKPPQKGAAFYRPCGSSALARAGNAADIRQLIDETADIALGNYDSLVVVGPTALLANDKAAESLVETQLAGFEQH